MTLQKYMYFFSTPMLNISWCGTTLSFSAPQTKIFSSSCGSPGVVLGPAASAAPGNLLEIWMHRQFSWSVDQRLWGWSPAAWGLTSPPGGLVVPRIWHDHIQLLGHLHLSVDDGESGCWGWRRDSEQSLMHRNSTRVSFRYTVIRSRSNASWW